MKQLFCIWMVCIGAYATAQPPQGTPPQGGRPPKRPPIEQRIKRLNDTLSKSLPVTAAQKKTIDDAFTTFFTQADKIIGDNPPPRPEAMDEKSQQMREQLKKVQRERDEKIEKVLTVEQFKKYQQIERNLRPKPPGNMQPPPPQKNK